MNRRALPLALLSLTLLAPTTAWAATPVGSSPATVGNPQQRPGDGVDVRDVLWHARTAVADDARFVAFLHEQFGDLVPADARLLGANLYRVDVTSPSWGNVSPDRYTNQAAIIGIAWEHADGSPGRSDVITLHYERAVFVEATIAEDTMWGSDEILTQTPRITFAEALAAFERFRAEHGYPARSVVDYATLRTPQTTHERLTWMFVVAGQFFFVDAMTGQASVDDPA